MTMTADGKKALSSTIRDLRERLLSDLRAAADARYRLSVRERDAELSEAARARRGRLVGWASEQVRAQAGGGEKKGERSREDFFREAEKQAAYTLLNRLVMLRLLEAVPSSSSDDTAAVDTSAADAAPGSAVYDTPLRTEPLRKPAVVSGGWGSRGYQDFRQLAPALAREDESEGYQFLLWLIFEELAGELPGLFGPAGVADLIPVPAATLRHSVEALDAPELQSCWSDDMTLGWVYQYWNDPERESLDAKLNDGGKVEPHEIASKTQMFTERYMVDWLLQNSLGPMWLAMCRKHGWTPEVESDGTLARLEARRTQLRQRRENGEVSATALMPLHSAAERRWAYYVPQAIPEEAVSQAPESLRDLRLLDPAVGSGHFLVVALDLLFALYREEARHRGEAGGEAWSDRAIVEHILTHNLCGIDLDPRAVQIAAAALWLKARQISKDAHPRRLNLVASRLRLASLRDDDPALAELRRSVEEETGVPGELTDTIVHALRGADHLGSLLKIDQAVDEAIARHERAARLQSDEALFEGGAAPSFEAATARQTLLDRLEAFLARHTGGDDLGLRLRGEQLAAGVRFVRLVREGAYDLVVANPPYQGTSKVQDAKYVEKQYPLGKADLYAAFLLRGLELVRDGGVSAMLTMRNWMFIKQYAGLREHLFGNHGLRAIGDVSWGAFREMRDNPVAMSIVMRGPVAAPSLAMAPTDPQERVRTQEEFAKKEAGLRCHVGRHEFDPAALKVVPEWPLVYWWDAEYLREYDRCDKLGDTAPVRVGMKTSDNSRFARLPWEVGGLVALSVSCTAFPSLARWVPYVQGASGLAWIEPLRSAVKWERGGLEVRLCLDRKYGMGPQCETMYFRPGVAFSPIGSAFSARAHRYRSIFSTTGTSVFPGLEDVPRVLCLLNSTFARQFLEAINPSIHFEVGDVNRVAVRPQDQAKGVIEDVECAFTEHESHREPSVEFQSPGPSPWRHAQEWAQAAVDRPEGTPLPPYEPEYNAEPATDHLSFALGVALGRFGADGEGILDPGKDDLSRGLPAGILFLDLTLDEADRRDGLGHAAAEPIHAAWKEHGPAIGTKRKTLREWLALDFFKDVHKGMYENRPIHWPLSSSGKTFVAWVNIHRFTEQTLRVLLADWLHPALNRLEGELADLQEARSGDDKKAARAAEKRFDQLTNAKADLEDFIRQVEQCDSQGPPPTDKCPAREQDARYAPELDDGVMINSAALWPLLEPQWKDPKKWWKELASAKGRKDYDWSHLATRYWPTRVDEKCQEDPSLGVAHGCFWRYHPPRAWAWELRLQDEIGPSFRIEEPPYRPGGRDLGDAGDAPHREAFLRDHPEEALAAIEKEAIRRMGRGKDKKVVPELRLLEPGLWTHHPEDLWTLELRLTEKQGADFRVTAPDEPEARAAFEAAHPEKIRARKELAGKLLWSEE